MSSLLATALMLSALAATPKTIAVRAGRSATGSVAAMLSSDLVAEKYCNSLFCVALPATSQERANLDQLAGLGRVTLETLADSRKLFFQKACAFRTNVNTDSGRT